MTSNPNPITTHLPAPTRASAEFPDSLTLETLGLTALSLDEARIVACALSAFISAGRSKDRTKVGVMISMLVGVCHVTVVRDGEEQAAALPDLPDGPWPHGRSVFAQLDIDHDQLEAYWRLAKNRADDACLPREWLLAWVPAPLWAALAIVLRWGPYEGGVRAEEATAVFAQTPIHRGTRRRAEGSMLAAGTIQNRVDAFWAVLRAFVDLRAKVESSKRPTLDAELLRSWATVPDRVDVKACGAREARLDTAGPPIAECSANLRRLFEEWQRARPKWRYRALRRLLLQALLPLYGPRVDALRRLDVADYLPDHLGSDGVRGPILRIFPAKTRDPDEAYLLPLPAEIAEWLEEWIAYTGRSIGANSPMWPSRKPKAEGAIKRISESGLYCAIAGREGDGGNHGNSRALIPRDANPSLGYHPHSYRHASYQAAKRAGVAAKEARPVEFGHVDQEDFARAICGHSLRQSLKDAYLDLHQLRLARAAVEYAWKDLWRGGKRYGLDPHAILASKNEVRTLAAVVGELEATVSELHRRQETLAKASATLSGDALHSASIESNRLASQTQLVLVDLNRTRERQRLAEDRLAAAEQTQVALPDEMSDLEHARLLAMALEIESVTDTEEGDPRLADELTVSDLAELFGTSPQTINGWVRNGFPGRRPSPWDSGAWIIDGDRRKRLPVSALDRSGLTAAQAERLDLIRRRRGAHPETVSLLSV